MWARVPAARWESGVKPPHVRTRWEHSCRLEEPHRGTQRWGTRLIPNVHYQTRGAGLGETVGCLLLAPSSDTANRVLRAHGPEWEGRYVSFSVTAVNPRIYFGSSSCNIELLETNLFTLTAQESGMMASHDLSGNILGRMVLYLPFYSPKRNLEPCS